MFSRYFCVLHHCVCVYRTIKNGAGASRMHFKQSQRGLARVSRGCCSDHAIQPEAYAAVLLFCCFVVLLFCYFENLLFCILSLSLSLSRGKCTVRVRQGTGTWHKPKPSAESKFPCVLQPRSLAYMFVLVSAIRRHRPAFWF